MWKKQSATSIALAPIMVALWFTAPVNSQSPPNEASGVAVPAVLLKNENVLFGHAYQVGEFVVVRTGENGEIQLRRSEVACWANSIRDLYRYKVDHREENDLASHLRDARWCIRYDLYDLAAQEIETIQKFAPNHAEVESLAKQLRRLTEHAAVVRTANQSGPAEEGGPSSVQTAAYQPAEPIDAASKLAKSDPATVRLFASHVQPMILNRCGRCHNQELKSASDPRWRLTMPASGSRASARITRENLSATLAYIDPRAAEASELLVKATTPHGGAAAPLDARNAKAIDSLKAWITLATSRMVVTGPPHDAGASMDDARVRPSAPASQPASSEPFVAQRPDLMTPRPHPDTAEQPRRLPQVANPFDPDLFNRHFHRD